MPTVRVLDMSPISNSFIKPSVKLWKHQEKLVDSAMKHGEYNLWYAGCGTGKTLASIVLADELRAKRILVLTSKAAVKSVWEQEISKWTEGVKVVAPLGTTTKRKRQVIDVKFIDTTVFLVVNYEFAWRIQDVIESLGFDLVIADECHKLQSPNSKSSTILALVCRRIPFKLAMTGTLMEDKVTQVYGQVRFLSSSIYRKKPISTILGKYSDFRDYYEVTRQLSNRATIVVGSKNLHMLANEIQSFTYHLDSEKVLDLPDCLDIVRLVDLDSATRTMYDSMRVHKIVEILDGSTLVADNILTQLIRLQEISLGHYTTHTNPMIAQLEELVNEIGNKPIVIFVRFVKDVQIISEMYNNNVCYLTGAINELADWNAGKHNILVANIAAGSESVDLTRAKYVIYYSKTFSRTQYVQSRYRVRRPPATDRIIYYHIIAKNTVGSLVEEALDKKAKVMEYLLERLEN